MKLLENFSDLQIIAVAVLCIVVMELLIHVLLKRNQNIHQDSEESDEYQLFSLLDYTDPEFMSANVKFLWRVFLMVISISALSCWISDLSEWRLAWLCLVAVIGSWYIVPVMIFIGQFLYDVILVAYLAAASGIVMLHEVFLHFKRKFMH